VAAAPSPWAATLLAGLADGLWHPAAPLVRAAAARIPPGMATRKNEQARTYAAKAGARDADAPALRGRVKSLSVSEQIAAGRRLVIHSYVHKAVHDGRLESSLPFPPGAAAWAGQVEWLLRDPTAQTISPTALATRLSVGTELLARLRIKHDLPSIPVGTRGRQLRIRLADVPLYEAMIAEEKKRDIRIARPQPRRKHL
jgi:hypothetical protein